MGVLIVMTYQEILSAVQTLPISEKALLLENISASLRRDLMQRGSAPSQSLYGLFADLGAAPSETDIDEARREMWANFPREEG
jgi:hypothetical protein